MHVQDRNKVITECADAFAPKGARPSAGIMSDDWMISHNNDYLKLHVFWTKFLKLFNDDFEWILAEDIIQYGCQGCARIHSMLRVLE